MVLAAPITSTARDDRDDMTTYRARLTGFGEVPPKLVDGQGKFTGTLSADGASISWTLTWTELTGPAQAAHIHFGQPQNTGSVVVFFCGGGAGPRARTDPGHSGSVSGTWTAVDILPVVAQNVTAGDFAGFLRILRVRLGVRQYPHASVSRWRNPGTGQPRRRQLARGRDSYCVVQLN